MTIAVLNATGAQARAIADRLEREHPVRRLSRRSGAGLTSVDAGSRDALARVFEGASAVVFTSPLDYAPGVREAYARRVVDAAAAAGVEKIVLNTAAAVPPARDPSAEALHAVRDVVRQGPVPFVVVQPTVYLDNLLAPRSLPAIIGEGVFAYPLREDAEVSWISHAALAEFVAAALDSEAAVGRTFDIGGPESLTGPSLAAIIGAAAGREVRYVPIQPTDFAEGLIQTFGPGAALEIGGLYRRVADAPHSLARVSEPWRVVGAEPETAQVWARRQVWRV